jgi:hypothetical protein
VTRLISLSLLAVCAMLMSTGCAGSTKARSQSSTPGSTVSLPLVIAHPTVEVKYRPSAKLRHLGIGGRLISPTQLAFMTMGSTGCLWLPTRLTVLSPTAIRIAMRFPFHRACLDNLIRLPIAVKINPRIVNVHRPLTVRLAYKANYCCGERSRRSHRTFIAPAISSS